MTSEICYVVFKKKLCYPNPKFGKFAQFCPYLAAVVIIKWQYIDNRCLQRLKQAPNVKFSPKFWGSIFFSWPGAGLTNQVHIRHSDSRVPLFLGSKFLEINLKDYVFSMILRFQIAKIYCVVDVIELAVEHVFWLHKVSWFLMAPTLLLICPCISINCTVPHSITLDSVIRGSHSLVMVKNNERAEFWVARSWAASPKKETSILTHEKKKV